MMEIITDAPVKPYHIKKERLNWWTKQNSVVSAKMNTTD
jgi:hypothetical protein